MWKEEKGLTDQKQCPCSSRHQWTQAAPFTPAWVQITSSTTKCNQEDKTVNQNPVFPSNAALPMCTPLKLKKTGPCTMLVTVSIPAESMITLPTKALQIKMIRKNLKITQCRFFNCVPPPPGIPHDTPKLFLVGSVRKDIQYSEAVRQTATTVEGTVKDFVVDIPISYVVDLGKRFIFPPSGFSSKDRMLSSDLTEFNLVSQSILNSLPTYELLFYQINEMDDALDRVPLQGGPIAEGIFSTLQEKMIVLIQIRLTFQSNIDHRTTRRADHHTIIV